MKNLTSESGLKEFSSDAGIPSARDKGGNVETQKIKPVQLKLDKLTVSEYLRTQGEKNYLVYVGLFLSDFNILLTGCFVDYVK